MGDSSSITHDRFALSLLAVQGNFFPVSGDEYWCSKWHKWIERINASHNEHCDRIDNEYLDKKSDKPKIWGVTIDHYKSIGDLGFITEGMFASLVVSMHSYVELYYSVICTILYIHANNLSASPTHIVAKECKSTSFKEVKTYIQRFSSVDIEDVEFADIANAVRILSNTYKHDHGIYKAKKNNMLPENLAKSWGIDRNHSVIYSKLNFAEILIGCGQYCDKLKGEVEAVLKR